MHHRSGDVRHHCDYPDAVFRDRDVRGSGTCVADGVHAHIRAVFCQVLHHRSDSFGGGCPRGFAAGCHHIIGLFSKGEETHFSNCIAML